MVAGLVKKHPLPGNAGSIIAFPSLNGIPEPNQPVPLWILLAFEIYEALHRFPISSNFGQKIIKHFSLIDRRAKQLIDRIRLLCEAPDEPIETRA